VIHKPGLTLVYAPDAPRFGNLIMSHSEAGAGNDEFGNQYRDGDTAYRDAFIRSSPRERMGIYVPDASSGSLPPPASGPHNKPPRDPPDSDACPSRSASSSCTCPSRPACCCCTRLGSAEFRGPPSFR
jgi:hypothetical protein